MKKIITLVVTILMFATANQAQTLEKLFDKYADDERFEYVSIGGGMMNLAGVLGGLDKKDKNIVSKMRGLKILTLNANSESTLWRQLDRDLKELLKVGNFESAVEARDKGEKVNIYYRFGVNNKSDMLIVSQEKGEFSLIWISGKMSKEEMMNSFSNTNNSLIRIRADNDKSKDTLS
ncbi:MAG: DUF4252 domain-containing protein [Paludibacter sp.]|nr:DUF4252 domain-containing protein [Paludibacter sp.]